MKIKREVIFSAAGTLALLALALILACFVTEDSHTQLATSFASPPQDDSADTFSVTRPVRETQSREISYTVMRPVRENRTKTVSYTVMTVVRENHTKIDPVTGEERSYTVARHVPKQREKTVDYVVTNMVPERKHKTVEYQTLRFETTQVPR